MLRAVASQLLVWHHLAFYGPLADLAYPLAPVLLDWLVDPARFVVQVFLVIGGFGTAQHLARLPDGGWWPFCREIVQRYRRIGIPYVAMLPVAIVANALAGHWMEHHSISGSPTLSQVVAHAFFAQDLLRYEPLTAGIWYLAIDFQLFVLALAVMMLAMRWTWAHGAARPARAVVLMQRILVVPAILSLFWFNRDPAFDCWGFYYLGSYFLGMLVWSVVSGGLRHRLVWAYLALMVAAVAVDWRPRLLVAAATALVILAAAERERLPSWTASRLIGGLGIDYLGKISFSLFLIHFPVCLVVSGWLSQWPLTPAEALAGMVAAWGASLLLAIAFHHTVERPWWRRPARAPAG